MSAETKMRPAADYKCVCGAVHGVTLVTSDTPASDSAECEWCGRTITRWQNKTTFPVYEMKTAPG
jgi:hypothetical protein